MASRLPARRSDIRYIPHGVPVPTGPLPIYTGDEIRLAYHGRLTEEQKHVSYLIRLAKCLRGRGVPFKLRLIGEGEDRERYLRDVRILELTQNVEFLGSLEWDPLVRVLQKSHIAVLASKYEGFCLSLAEAMGIGLPAVIFECGGGTGDYFKNDVNGFVVPWGDVEAMADKIQCLQQNLGLWSEFSQKARAQIQENFHLEDFTRRVAEYISELINSDNHRSWPRLRPVITRPGRSISSVVERCGRAVGGWR